MLRRVQRLHVVALLAVVLGSCSPQAYNERYRLGLATPDKPEYYKGLIFARPGIELFRPRKRLWLDDLAWYYANVDRFAKVYGINYADVLANRLSMDSIIRAIVEEHDGADRYGFFHLGFHVRRARIRITGPGALIITFKNEHGETFAQRDKGIMFTDGKHSYTWAIDSINGPVDLDPSTSAWAVPNAPPQHAVVRFDRSVRSMAVVSVRVDSTRWIVTADHDST